MGEIIPILLVQGAPLWLALAFGTLMARRAVRRQGPRVAAYEAWKQQQRELAAAVIQASYKADNMEEMLVAQGRQAAHAQLKPELPRWMFWVN